MKNKKEQIEEIENVLKNEQIRISNTSDGFKDLMKNGVCSVHSKAIYSAGYRKASDVIDEFVERLKDILTKYEFKTFSDGAVLYSIHTKSFSDEIAKIAAEMRQEVEK